MFDDNIRKYQCSLDRELRVKIHVRGQGSYYSTLATYTDIAEEVCSNSHAWVVLGYRQARLQTNDPQPSIALRPHRCYLTRPGQQPYPERSQ